MDEPSESWPRCQALEARVAELERRLAQSHDPEAEVRSTSPFMFQALRILVNRELANLEQLLRVLPQLLKSGRRAAIISFHSGEDRLVKAAFRDGLRTGLYDAVSEEPIRAKFAERTANPRSRSAKLRWARRGG